MACSDALLHLLDPVWANFPFPVTPGFSETRLGPLTRVTQSRRFRGQPLLPVSLWVVGDTLVDTGLASLGRQTAALAERGRVRRAIVTHHHEDHSGGARDLQRGGVQVVASAATSRILTSGFNLHLYEHVVWGKAPRTTPEPLGAEVEVGGRRGVVVAAPGHCVDQVAIFVPEEGWLFSGDAFLHEQVRVFRRDEDFGATLATLRTFITLDFDALLCAHRPRMSGGRAAIQAKLAWLEHVEGRVRARHATGAPPGVIAKELQLTSARGVDRVAFGDVSGENMVRSILHGPTPRRDIARVAS
jgi:glyoxylase-like metal-dependent hydrolase (beta-lactamase superfamily II)